MISSEDAKRYLFYALGEITLVVVGILIALQINNWNEQRKERVQEKEVLNTIKENLESNIENLQYTISSIERHSPAGQKVYDYLRTKNDTISITPEDWHWALITRGDLQLSASG